MTTTSSPDILALIQEIHANLDQIDYPLSRVVPKVIRVASLLADYVVVARYKLELMDGPTRAEIDAMMLQFANCAKPSTLAAVQAVITAEWFSERLASMSNLGKEESKHQALMHSVSQLELTGREMRRAYDDNILREQGEWFKFMANSQQEQEFYSQRTFYHAMVCDIEAILERLRVNITNYLSQAETKALSLLSAPEQTRHLRETPVVSSVDKRRVFVVYGRDEAIRSAVFAFLRAAGLDPPLCL